MTPSLLTYVNDYLTLIVLSYILVRRRYGCAINKVHNGVLYSNINTSDIAYFRRYT